MPRTQLVQLQNCSALVGVHPVQSQSMDCKQLRKDKLETRSVLPSFLCHECEPSGRGIAFQPLQFDSSSSHVAGLCEGFTKSEPCLELQRAVTILPRLDDRFLKVLSSTRHVSRFDLQMSISDVNH